MRKSFKISLCIVLALMLVLVTLTGFFTKGLITGHIYFPQNVFEEIWNMVVAEEHRQETLLTSATEDAYVDWDFGFDFVGVYIPSCKVSLHTRYEELQLTGMTIYFWLEDQYYQFDYIYETKMLYGDVEEAYLIEHFLTDYFQWYEFTSASSSKFSLDDLGDYTYLYTDPIWSYKLLD